MTYILYNTTSGIVIENIIIGLSTSELEDLAEYNSSGIEFIDVEPGIKYKIFYNKVDLEGYSLYISKLLQDSIIVKLTELDSYHYSDQVRTVVVNGHNIINNMGFRTLIAEQRDILKEKLDLDIISPGDDIFNYRYNGSGVIPLTLLQLRNIHIQLTDLAGLNYNTHINHRNAIKALSSIDDILDGNGDVIEVGVTNYDYTPGYLINQAITL